MVNRLTEDMTASDAMDVLSCILSSCTDDRTCVRLEEVWFALSYLSDGDDYIGAYAHHINSLIKRCQK